MRRSVDHRSQSGEPENSPGVGVATETSTDSSTPKKQPDELISPLDEVLQSLPGVGVATETSTEASTETSVESEIGRAHV